MAAEIRADWATKDFYQVLGVGKNASSADIKKAYRKLAREHHPDSNPGDTKKHETFKSVAEAYDVLGDAEKREAYDTYRSQVASGPFPGGFGGGGGFRPPGGFDIDDVIRGHAGGFGDIFGDFIGNAGRRGSSTQNRPRPVRGNDVESTATIAFTDSIEGVTISLRLTSDAACQTCRGTGGKPGTKPHICSTCEGAGFIVSGVGGAFSLNETCPACRGRQLVYDEPCPTCGGSGRGTSARTIQARIPAGVKDGQRIRLKGKGGPGENSGPAGDLFVTVKVTPHRLFGRKDDNLTIEVPVSFDEAALGADVKIPTLGGAPVTLKIPAGTPNGRTFRVRGRGARKKDGTNGDLLATVQVHVPAVLSEQARQAVEDYRAATEGSTLRSGLFEAAQA
ncbi:molecular chaperone DnaJ [Nocardioides agariphilus]|jgi:molecular chaperone DnaJ|uniref:Chaperone protein DnaJ n=1 Tax=Nocardioides agariphilus TaxID=433664 RepID=A0A930VN89_9ACTN|nr:molecular chaperone DnaJ [Nocardioides agariphilus]MBF4768721.1 molecular chaperone DnaJ [Nocardioides agariphilus]